MGDIYFDSDFTYDVDMSNQYWESFEFVQQETMRSSTCLPLQTYMLHIYKNQNYT